MKKQEKQQEKHSIDEFDKYIHLWNIIPGGSGNGIVLLRKIVDAIQNDNYLDPGNKPPSVLLTRATGKRLASLALANSLALEDIRECPSKYFENGIFAHQFFTDSLIATAHIITDIEQLKEKSESVLWKFLKNRECIFYNNLNRSYDSILHCNGLIVMTAKDVDKIPDKIIEATDYIIELEPFNRNQLLTVIHQRLVFCGVEYTGEEVLNAVVEQGKGNIDLIMQFLKKCLMILKSEMGDSLTVETVKKASRLCSLPVQPNHHVDDIPF